MYALIIITPNIAILGLFATIMRKIECHLWSTIYSGKSTSVIILRTKLLHTEKVNIILE